MKRLAPDFFSRRFDDLLETGLSRLPSLAPRWTDYNTHDPGITLMDLLAFVAEAQLYSLARMRRDERAAYAALLGLRAEGPAPAAGSLWPDRRDPESPFLSFQQSLVIGPDALVRVRNGDTPAFHPTHRLLWTPGRITSLRTLLADGRVLDHTRANEQGDRAFEPFGPAAASGDRLRIDFGTNGDRGLFPAVRAEAAQALWPIGVRLAPALLAVSPDESPTLKASSLSVQMRIGGELIDLPVVADGTRGLMQSGVLLLDVAGVPISPSKLAIELRAPRGFARAPRIRALDVGVLPVVQGGIETGEAHVTTGVPGQRIVLQQPGLRFGAGIAPLKVAIREDGELREWHSVDDLAAAGPTDRVFQLDIASESFQLGNGVNGHLPDAGLPIAVDYPFCNGSAANTPRRQRWSVRGIAGTFGINPDPIGGGRDRDTDLDLRRRARSRLRAAHALVTARDIESAARALPDLEVARAHVVTHPPRRDVAVELTLLAMRARISAEEPAEAPETTRWLSAVRRALLPRLPLGTRLSVRAPGYRNFTLRARLEAAARRNPADIEAAARERLRDAFALTPRKDVEPRALGAPVTTRDLAALLRKVPGVRRVISLTLLAVGRTADSLVLGRGELPRLLLDADSIRVERGTTRGEP